jgi:transposase-like protein
LPVDDPAHVARLRIAQEIAGRCFPQQALDLVHGSDQVLLRRWRQTFQHGGHLAPRRVDQGARVRWPASVSCRRVARIRGRARLGDQPLLVETADHPAQVARVQAQLAAQVRAGEIVPMRQLIQDAHFRQRKRAVEQVFMQHANLARIKTVEAAHAVRAFTEWIRMHAGPPFACLWQIIACF